MRISENQSLHYLLKDGVEESSKAYFPQLRQVHQELYGGYAVEFFGDAHPVAVDGRLNNAQLAALSGLVGAMENGASLVFGMGPMGVGKSTLADLLAGHYGERVQVFQHEWGRDREETEELKVKLPNGGTRSTGVWAETYSSLDDLRNRVKLIYGGVVVADEFQFVDVDAHELHGWKRWLGEVGMRGVVLGLDQTFLGQPWKNTKAIVQAADYGVVLAARCAEDGCGSVAWRTKRIVHLEDGSHRAASVNDPIVLVGGVDSRLTDDYYLAACEEHFEVSP